MFGDDDKGVEYFRAAKLSIQWQLLISAADTVDKCEAK
jgi:hypothetical protein